MQGVILHKNQRNGFRDYITAIGCEQSNPSPINNLGRHSFCFFLRAWAETPKLRDSTEANFPELSTDSTPTGYKIAALLLKWLARTFNFRFERFALANEYKRTKPMQTRKETNSQPSAGVH
jgi:hypothetical protein